jgi:hypothetical protein
MAPSEEISQRFLKEIELVQARRLPVPLVYRLNGRQYSPVSRAAIPWQGLK